MLPIRFDPMRELSTLQREMDDLFKRMFGSNREIGESSMLTTSPAVNSFIKNGVFHLEAELPGVDTDKLDVRMDDGNLVIHGERRSTHKTEDVNYLLKESSLSTFERRMSLPTGADIEKAHATYNNGMLEVTVPINEAKLTGRKIPIEGVKSGKKSKEIH
ncbi:Hsp20/alpha crystallin family protein [Deltaproteobacteria bacterium IMCC39524]|nr:Hsp20/alpha crystallin family protein [Deltaproteobacteria bacterium IMCC39524]